jgi:hypothetical protein
MPIIPALKRVKQENYKPEANPGPMVKACLKKEN